MKSKLLLTTLIFAFSVSSLHAQDFKLGVKAGVNIHKIDGKSFKDEFSYGYHLGGFASIGLTKKFAIQPEVLFSQVSADTSSNFSDVYDFNSVSKVQLKYLQIPLLLNYNPNPFVSLQVGPQFGILVDQNSNMVKNGREAFSKGDFSMLGGIQLNISKIRLYGRYAVGLNNINDIDDQEKWKNQSFQVGVGFAL